MSYKFLILVHTQSNLNKGYGLATYATVLLRYLLCLGSSDIVNFVLPLALLLANMAQPLDVDMRLRKPCLLLLFLSDG